MISHLSFILKNPICLYSTGAHGSAIDLASLSALKLIRPDNSLEHKRTGSRILLTLAKWLQREGIGEDYSNLQMPINYNLIDIHETASGGLDVLMMPCKSAKILLIVLIGFFFLLRITQTEFFFLFQNVI